MSEGLFSPVAGGAGEEGGAWASGWVGAGGVKGSWVADSAGWEAVGAEEEGVETEVMVALKVAGLSKGWLGDGVEVLAAGWEGVAGGFDGFTTGCLGAG